MKRFFILLPVLLLAFCSCKKDDFKEVDNYPVPEPGTSYLLEGTVTTEGFAWQTNSSVGLYSAMSELKIINKECRIAGWANTDPVIDPETGENTNVYAPSEYEGKAVARFNTPALDLVQGENRFMIYSPYNSELTFVDGVIYGLSIGDSQVQSAPNVAAGCFAFGNASGIPGVDEAFSFELNPVTALAQVKISSSSLEGFAPKKVTIYDDSNSPMAGNFNINVNTMEFTQVGTPLNRVSVEVSNEVALASGASQNIYLNILPADYSGKELWVVVELVDESGARLTIPTKQSDLKFETGKTTIIDLTGLNTDMNAAGDWYAATETRLLPGNGVAYGEANTYFIQCKNGSTYNGAAYSPNAAIPDEVTIDYRARGNFYNAEKPENVTFEWATLSNGTLYTPRLADYSASGVVVDNSTFTFTHNEAAKTVTVKNNGSFAGAPVLVMKKDGKVLWAWSFWNVAADGTSIDPVQVAGYGFAPMDIGQPTVNMDAWTANSTAAGNPDVMFRMTHYYQWGRPVPIFWTTFWSVDGMGTTGNVPAIEGPLSLGESLEHPATLIVNKVENLAMANWCTENSQDLWGEINSEKEGTKSIYDPCPKGWRVASLPALTALAENTPAFNDETGKVSVSVGDLALISQGWQTARIKTTGARPENMGMGNTGNASGCGYGQVWSNIAGQSQGQSLYWTSSAKSPAHEFRIASFDRSYACAVRCIVDKDNR